MEDTASGTWQWPAGNASFLCNSTILAFFWPRQLFTRQLFTRQEFGDFAAVMSVTLFTTLPIALAFSGLAYTDVATGRVQCAALFAFTPWFAETLAWFDVG